jgi:hypothetical protein
MYDTSNEYKVAIKSASREWKLTILVYADRWRVNWDYTIGDEDIRLGSFKYTESVMPTDSFDVGGGMLSEVAFSIMDPDQQFDAYSFIGSVIVPQVGPFYWITEHIGTYEQIPVGRFVVDEAVRENNYIKVRAFDYMAYTDVPFRAKPVNGVSPSDTFGTAAMFPCEMHELLEAIGTHCGVFVDFYDDLNLFYTIEEMPDGDPSCREMLRWAAQLAACWLKTDRDGVVSFVPIQNPQYLAEASLDGNIDAADGGMLNARGTVAYDGGAFAPNDIDFTTEPTSRYKYSAEVDAHSVTGLKYEASDVVYLVGSEKNCVDLSENKLIHETGIADLLYSIAARVIGYTYLPYTADWIGDPAVQAGDLVEHTDRNGRTFRSVVAESKFNYRGASTLTAGGVAESANKYKRT